MSRIRSLAVLMFTTMIGTAFCSAPTEVSYAQHKRTAAKRRAGQGSRGRIVAVYTPISVIVNPTDGGVHGTADAPACNPPIKQGQSITVRVYLQKVDAPGSVNEDIFLEVDRDQFFGKSPVHNVRHFYYFHSDFEYQTPSGWQTWRNYEPLPFPAPSGGHTYSELVLRLVKPNLEGQQVKFIASNKSIGDYAAGTVKVVRADGLSRLNRAQAGKKLNYAARTRRSKRIRK